MDMSSFYKLFHWYHLVRSQREREREIPFCSFVMAKKRENNSWKPPDFSGGGGYKGRDIFEFQARRHKGDHVEV